MNLNLASQIALVASSTDGIGQVIAISPAAEGTRVNTYGRNEDTSSQRQR